MLVGLDALASVALLEAELLVHPIENALVDGHRVNANLNTFEIRLARHEIEPRMLPDLINGVPLLRVRVQYPSQQIIGLIRNVIWRLEIGAQNFLVQIRCIRILKRQITANESEQDDAARPNVYVSSMILLSSYHLRRCVAWRTASSFQQFASLVSIT